METGGETSSGPKLATLSRKLTQSENPGHLEGHGGGKNEAGVATGKGKTLPTSTFKALLPWNDAPD